jgi:hypothetical protein
MIRFPQATESFEACAMPESTSSRCSPAEVERAHWQAGMEALIPVATKDGPKMLARIGVLPAERVFESSDKEHHLRRRKRLPAYPSFVTLSKQAPNRQFMPSGHGRRGRAPAGHSLRTAPAVQPSTTHPPLGAPWQPGPHPSVALAALKIERLPANRTATKRVLNVTSMVGPHPGQAFSSEEEMEPRAKRAKGYRIIK